MTQNLLENTCARVSFLKTLLKKRLSLAQLFSCEFREIFKNTVFYRTPLVAASYPTKNKRQRRIQKPSQTSKMALFSKIVKGI